MRADQLREGLDALGADFNAHLCEVCKGEGKYEQSYTIGCGMGSYWTMGKCDWCRGQGLMQGDGSAPQSVINQVLQAATSAAEGERKP